MFLSEVETFFESQKLHSFGYGGWNKWSETKEKSSFSLNRFLMWIEIKTQECSVSWHSALFFPKNKKQRMMVRAAVLKMKDPKQIIRDMEKLDEMGKNFILKG